MVEVPELGRHVLVVLQCAVRQMDHHGTQALYANH